MASTKIELVAILRERQKALPKRSGNLAWVIERARNGKYHDWDSDLDTPKLQLVTDLRSCKKVDLEDVIARVVDGEFDEDPTVAQLEELREEVGAEAYDKLFPDEAKKRGSA